MSRNVVAGDWWVASLSVIVAAAIVLVGFHKAHANAARDLALLNFRVPPRATVSEKLLPWPAIYSLDSVSDGSDTRSFGGAVHRSISIRSGKTLTLAGWVVDDRDLDVAAGVYADVDAKEKVMGVYGSPRPDVADAYSNPFYAKSGFQIVVPADFLPRGRHSVSLDVYAQDGLGRYRDPDILAVLVR